MGNDPEKAADFVFLRIKARAILPEFLFNEKC